MSNLANYPRQSAYRTTLAQPVDSSSTTLAVKTAPNFTLSSGGCYGAISPNNSSLFEIVLITAISGTSLTVTRGIATYEGGASSAVAHSAGEEFLISDSWKNFDDIKTAISSKLDQDGGNAGSTFNLALSGSDFRIRKDGSDMKLRDDNQSEVTLSQLASLSGVNDKVKVSSNDTTEDYLINKIVGGDGIATPTQVNDGGDEDISLAVDLATDPGLEFSSGGLRVKAGTGIVRDSSGINVDVGTGANQIVQRGASGEYPSGDGSALTNIKIGAPNIGSGSRLASAGDGTVNITSIGFEFSYIEIYFRAGSAGTSEQTMKVQGNGADYLVTSQKDWNASSGFDHEMQTVADGVEISVSLRPDNSTSNYSLVTITRTSTGFDLGVNVISGGIDFNYYWVAFK